jgi:inner membrane protein
MDTVTHTLFGLTTYAAIDKTDKPPPLKKALLLSSLIGSQIPDSDIVLNLTEKGKIMEQMWHRGITHSFFMTPIWALLIYFICFLIWKRKDKIIFYAALVNVLIHIGFDGLNTWGTGLIEPFSSARISLGIIPIIDFVIWTIFLSAFIVSKIKKNLPRYQVGRFAWLLIAIHVAIQGIQGFIFFQEAKGKYEEAALSAGFIPSHFQIIGKNDDVVEIYNTSLWGGAGQKEIIYSAEDADLTPLFAENPKAKVLETWSPFVVIVDDDERLGLFDPRFFRNGESFLFEYIEKAK